MTEQPTMPQPGPARDAVALDDAPLTCTEDGCPTLVPDAPDNRCGGPDGGAQGCGELFCGPHLFVTYRDGYLCDADYNNVEDRPVEGDDPGVSR